MIVKNSFITRGLAVRNFLNTFLSNQSIGGAILMVCAVIALMCANIPQLSFIHEIWHTSLGINIGSFSLEMTLEQWINDALMAVFFFVVGLEIKREMMVGELSSFKHASLPILAALGGMVVPAIIYAVFNHSHPESFSGWGIPMATDIAFALGVLSLLGNRAPLGLKVFLTALAIVDDLGAIVVLAIFYPTHSLHFDMLLYAAIIVLFLFALNRYKVNRPLLYMIPGVFLWYFIFKSGIHATISGVILALTIPSKTVINEVRFAVSMKYWIEKFKSVSNSEVEVLANSEQQHIIHQISKNAKNICPLMHKFEYGLHPWVTFFIMPVFALANAGVEITGDLFSWPVSPVVPGVFLGLFLGKPIGITLFSFIAVKCGIAELPVGTKWKQIFALGIIAGIGFTMSIFVDGLAFDSQELVNIGKATILGTSVVAAMVGCAAVYITSDKKDNNK
ncbi:MAG: Na+/H+ antiporter NhaA [Bacteroidales bacterium]|nr:Na+/H+ antiporter NhaA [Bacteroidales bacterium]